MNNVLRLAIVDPNDSTRDSLKSMLMGMESMWLEAECSRYEFFMDVAKETKPDVGVVALDSDPERALTLLRHIAVELPEMLPLVASSSTDGQLILKAMRAGAREFLTLPISPDELGSALERVGATEAANAEGKARSCEIVTVAGATGGVGSTSTAVNVACLLATNPDNSVALIDLDLALGDADVFLDTIPEYTLADVAHDISRLDIQMLKRSLTKHQSGLYLLPRPVDLQDAQSIRPESMEKVIALMKASFTHIIIDISKSYNPVDMVALNAATSICLVTQLDLPCLRNVVRLLMSFEAIDDLQEKTHIVVNRAGLDTGQISLKKAKETVGREIFAQLPNDYRTMVEVRNNGVPLVTQAPKAAITQALRELVTKLSGQQIALESAGVADKQGVGGGWRKFWPVQRSN